MPRRNLRRQRRRMQPSRGGRGRHPNISRGRAPKRSSRSQWKRRWSNSWRGTSVFAAETAIAAVINEHARERTILAGVGPVKVRRPRVDERNVRLTDGRWARAVHKCDLAPVPNLGHTVPQAGEHENFSTALAAIVGKEATGQSAKTISRLI